MAVVYEIKVPGAVFKDNLDAMRARMRGLIDAREPMLISLFFDYFQLTANNTLLGSQLLARGVVEPTGTSSYMNRGALIDTTIKDIGPDRRQVTIYIAPQVNLDVTTSGADLQFKFGDGDILLGIDDLPPELGFGKSFVLASIKWDSAGVRYIGREDGEPDHEIQILVDPTLQDAVFLSGIRGFRGGRMAPMRMVAFDRFNFSDDCCGGGFRAKPAPPREGPLCVNLHAKILTQPTIGIQAQVTALNNAYAAANITLNLASVELLTLPLLQNCQIGACNAGAVTPDQTTLFGNRNNAGSNDICAYWVTSLISPSGTVIGCAAHPPGIPALVMMGTANMSIFVLAHEVGHVLGLWHTSSDPGNATNLMFPVDGYNGVQPTLDGDQIGSMRWSGLLFSC